MSKNKNIKEQIEEQIEEQVDQPVEESQETKEESQESREEALEKRIAELEDKNLRMMAEFDNYRRRTNKEKLELMSTAGERIFTEMLPLIDDFERAIKEGERLEASGEKPEEELGSMKEGVKLIYQKFLSFLDKNDVHVIETDGVDFNTDEHEAVTTFAAGEDKKGKVIDCTQKGYNLGDKVIRFAKVVVGE
ncbi:MAG: nucleotide exchange factor GrpE [Paludibacteraceae bacterium]|nr:nucleotide exchange factor GrpE [Paludibacteraceae bacterium]